MILGKITFTLCPRKVRRFESRPPYKLLPLTHREFDAVDMGGGDGLEIDNEPTRREVGRLRLVDIVTLRELMD